MAILNFTKSSDKLFTGAINQSINKACASLSISEKSSKYIKTFLTSIIFLILIKLSIKHFLISKYVIRVFSNSLFNTLFCLVEPSILPPTFSILTLADAAILFSVDFSELFLYIVVNETSRVLKTLSIESCIFSNS